MAWHDQWHAQGLLGSSTEQLVQGPAAPDAGQPSLEQALGGVLGIQGWLGQTDAAAEYVSAAGMLAARQKHRGVGLELQHLPGVEYLAAKARTASCQLQAGLLSGPLQSCVPPSGRDGLAACLHKRGSAAVFCC